jgi:hypothetical protein
MDERSNLTFLLDVCQLMKRLTQLLKKQKYGDAENGEPKAKIMMLLQICATSSTKVLDWTNILSCVSCVSQVPIVVLPAHNTAAPCFYAHHFLSFLFFYKTSFSLFIYSCLTHPF